MTTTRQQRRQAERDAIRKGYSATYAEKAKLVLATVHPPQVHAAFDDSTVNALLYDAHSGSCAIGGRISLQSGPRIVASRNMVCEAFLCDPLIMDPQGNPFEWLGWCDADMRYPEDAWHVLLQKAESMRGTQDEPIKILGGLCFAGNWKSLYPTIYRFWNDDDGGVMSEPVEDYPKNEIVRVGGTGAAFFIVHREVLAAMGAKFSREAGAAYPWFEDGVNKRGWEWGEDLTFFLRAAACGYPTYIDTSVKVGHMKEIELNEELWDALAKLEELGIPFPMRRGKGNTMIGRERVA